MRELVDEGPFAGGAGRPQVELALKVVVAFLRSGLSAKAIAEQDPRQLAISIIGLHLFHFATTKFTGTLFDEEPFSAEGIEQRTLAVSLQVRRLCGLP
jgi:hypothetical protein